jgi:hypothetical protein
MTRDEFLGEFQVVKLNAETAKPLENDLVLIPIAAVRTPGCDANTSGAYDFQSDVPQVMLIVRPDRIGSCLHFLWLRRAEREEIADVECAASPRLSETDATGDGWVVDFVIGGRWVKHDEHAGRKRRVPRTLEPIAILSAGADDGVALHVLSMTGGDGSGIQRVSSKLESVARIEDSCNPMLCQYPDRFFPSYVLRRARILMGPLASTFERF